MKDQLNGNETEVEFARKIVLASRMTIAPTIAKNQFRHCGINVEE